MQADSLVCRAVRLFDWKRSLIDGVKNVDGIANVVPIGQTMIDVTNSRTGQRLIDGIDYDQYANLVNIRIVEGRKFNNSAKEVIIDTAFMVQRNVKVGDTMDMWEQPFKVVGTYEPAAGARVKVPLKVMQEQLGSEDKASAFLVKIEKGFEPEAAASNLSKAFPDNQIIFYKRPRRNLYERDPCYGSVPQCNYRCRGNYQCFGHPFDNVHNRD